MIAKVFCRHCGKKNIIEPQKKSSDLERKFYERCDTMLCQYCGQRMVTNVELLTNLGIANITLPKSTQICGRCKWISLPFASYCFKCGNPFSLIYEENHLPSQVFNRDKMLKVGEVLLERYVIVEVIQKGFSTDYIVFDHEKGGVSRIKSSPNINFINRIADIWLSIPYHKNILKAYSIENIHNRPHLFLEYVQGKDLRSVIEGEKSLNIPKALEIAIQICEGMEHLWSIRLVHRDLKPENIIIGNDDIVRIVDFDSAKIVEEHESPNSQETCGTPAYMSPEQWEGSVNVDNRSDIYSFGVTLFEMICGIKPFTPVLSDTCRSEAIALLYNKMYKKKDKPLCPKALRPDCPEALNNLILKCLEKKPENRYQSFGDVKRELINIREDLYESSEYTKETCIRQDDEVIVKKLSERAPPHDHWIYSLAGGRYKFLDRLAPNVCMAKDVDDSIVAVKKHLFSGPDGCPTYDDPLEEIKIHSELNHPHIVKFIRFHKEEGLYLVTKFVSGEPLVRKFFLKPAKEREALSILLQITDAVAYLHKKGIIHRDITPRNVIVSGSNATLIDFGSATRFEPTKPLVLWPMTVMCDAFLHLSYEWLRPPEIHHNACPQSDVFYIGVLGIFMLTGYLIFPLDTVPIYIYINAISATNPNINCDLIAILNKALSERIEMRFKDGEEMLLALKGI